MSKTGHKRESAEIKLVKAKTELMELQIAKYRAERQLIKVKDLAAELGCGIRTVINYVSRGVLPPLSEASKGLHNRYKFWTKSEFNGWRSNQRGRRIKN